MFVRGLVLRRSGTLPSPLTHTDNRPCSANTAGWLYVHPGAAFRIQLPEKQPKTKMNVVIKKSTQTPNPIVSPCREDVFTGQPKQPIERVYLYLRSGEAEAWCGIQVPSVRQTSCRPAATCWRPRLEERSGTRIDHVCGVSGGSRRH